MGMVPGSNYLEPFPYDNVKNHQQSQMFGTKWVGNRFHELSLGRNDRLGLGTSKIKFLAKNSKKNKEKIMIF
jgi:hypothetical protein